MNPCKYIYKGYVTYSLKNYNHMLRLKKNCLKKRKINEGYRKCHELSKIIFKSYKFYCDIRFVYRTVSNHFQTNESKLFVVIFKSIWI